MKNIFIFGVSSLMLAVPQGLLAQSDTTFVAVGNPIVKHKFIADPAAMVHDGKMYIYGGHDECPPPKEHYDLRWVLSIPFFISCIRQQNPLTVLSKIILRKVKQFNLPPQKK